MDKNLKIAIMLAATDKASAVLNKAFANAEKHAKSLGNIGKSISSAGDNMLIAGGISTAFFAKTVADARESQIAQDKLIQGFKTMGSTAEQAQRMIDFSGVQEFKWGVTDEEIDNVMGKLSTFKRTMTDQAIASGVFTRATQAAFDMQAKGFGDAMGNITQLGKALQNPAIGAQALAKAGAINKEDMPLIKYIQATKGIPAAQKYILDAVEKQVKGSAERMADPMKVLELQVGEASESIGKALLPTVNKLATAVANYAPKIQKFIEDHQDMILMAAKAGIALLAFGSAMKVVGFAISGIGTLVKGAGYAIKATSFIVSNSGQIAAFAVKGWEALKFAAFATQYAFQFSVLPALKAAGTTIVEFGTTLLASPITWYVAGAVALAAAVYLIYKNWDKISAFFTRVWAVTKAVFVRFWNWAKSYFLNFTPVGLIIKYWKPLSNMFGTVWQGVKNVFTGVWKWITNLGGKFWDAGANIVKSVWNGMKTMAHKPVEMIADMTKKIRSYLPFSPAKAGALRDIHRVRIVETIAQSIKARPLLDKMAGVTSSLYGVMNQPMPVMAGSGNQTVHFSPEIHLHGGANQKDADMMLAKMQQLFSKLMREYSSNKSRVSF